MMPRLVVPGTATQPGVGCAYCGLPLAGAETSPDAGPRYCCYGCRFAAALTDSTGETGASRWMMTRLGLAAFFTMNVMVFTMLLWSQRDGVPGVPEAAALYGLSRHACLLFTAPVMLMLGGPLFQEAWRELRTLRPSLNLLLAAGVAAAFLMSVHAVVADAGHVYFEVACMVLLAVTLGKWFEASGKLQTTQALRDLRTMLPDRVRRTRADGEELVPLAEIVVGDTLRVLPGERLPTDARILSGTSAIDERTVSGESMPVSKQAGDAVFSGTEVIDGPLLVTVTAEPGAGTLERLIATVEAAATTGSRHQRLADRVSAWFLPLVLLTAAATFVVQGWIAGWSRGGMAAGMMAAIAVVVVSCPCALGLATPMALWAAIGTAARRQVLVRDGDAFLRLGSATTFCFDKTGTLTTGQQVHAVLARSSYSTTDVLATAAALAHGSTHVLARAVEREALHRGVTPHTVDDLRTIAGRGIEGRMPDGRLARLGSARWIEAELGAAFRVEPGEPTRAACHVAIGPIVVGVIEFDESIRPGVSVSLAELEADGAETWLLSGDLAERAAVVAAAVEARYLAPLLPEEKLAFVRSRAPAVMVGDGINDAPAIAAADVGVALGCGADVSRWTAAICLLRDDIADLPWLVTLARRTERTIRWNLCWAFGYNAACIPLAACGVLHPALAAAAMVASSLFVVTGSLSLARDTPLERHGASDRRAADVAGVPA